MNRGGPTVEPHAAAVLMSPWTDLSSSGASMTERAGEDLILTPQEIRALAAIYPAGADPRTSRWPKQPVRPGHSCGTGRAG
jgi:acetyl esterase/lipase